MPPMRRFAPLLLLLACGKENKNGPAPAPTPTLLVDATVPTSAVDAGAPMSEAEALVRKWSDALDKHDVAALDALYTDPVFFYTGPLPKKQVLLAKKSALGPKSTFHQKIMGAIDINQTDVGYRAAFTKQSGSDGKMGETKAMLVLIRVADAGNVLRISEERDAPRAPKSCEEVASNVAWAIPAFKDLQTKTEKAIAKTPDAHEGGIGPETFDDGSVQASWGVHHPDRFERMAGYIAYRTGRLDVDIMADEYTTDPSGKTFEGADAKKLSAADAAKVMAACGPPTH
jgi:hypothetical protein